MDKEKLKKIAYVAVHGTGNEKSNARRILKNLGYDEPQILLQDVTGCHGMPQDDNSSKQKDHGFCPGIRIDFDIQALVDEIEETITDGISRKVKNFFKNFRI